MSPYVPLSRDEILEGLSTNRVPYVDKLRRCIEPGCAKILSRYNRSNKCYRHQLSPTERRARREANP